MEPELGAQAVSINRKLLRSNASDLRLCLTLSDVFIDGFV